MVLLAVVASPRPLHAEQVPPPPPKEAGAPGPASVGWDPAVRHGTLPNGLRYVLKRSSWEPGRLAARMVLGAGTASERDDERGLA